MDSGNERRIFWLVYTSLYKITQVIIYNNTLMIYTIRFYAKQFFRVHIE